MNKPRFLYKLGLVAMAASLLLSPLCADDRREDSERDNQIERREGERFQLGISAPAQHEAIRIEERRIAQEQANISQIESNADKKKYVNYNDAYFHGAQHNVYSKAIDGSAITMEDDSLWNICYYDHDVVRFWFSGDSIIIAPNSSWLNDYKYEIYNNMTGTKARANIIEGGLVSVTRTVSAIDFNSKRVYLNDGTCWQVSLWDDDLIYNWMLGSGVMIGINNKWDHSTNPYILIDIEAKQYVRARFVY